MSKKPSFLVKLGDGFYVDSEGKFHNMPDGSVPIYSSLVPTNYKELSKDAKKVLKGITEELSADTLNDVRSTLEPMLGGGTSAVISLLKGVRVLTSKLSTVFVIAGVAIAIADMFKLLPQKDDQVLKLINERFDRLETWLRELSETQDHINKLLFVKDKMNKVADALENVRTSTGIMESEHFNDDAIPTLISNIETARNEFAGPNIRTLVDPDTWKRTFHESVYSQVWASIKNFTSLRREPFTMDERTFFPPNQARFDHRLLVEALSVAIPAFLWMLKTSLPEYRSNAEYVEKLRTVLGRGIDQSLESGLDSLANELRQNLARTVYTAEHFSQPFHASRVVIYNNKMLLSKTYPVGALDLCEHTSKLTNARVNRYGMIDANPLPTMNWNWSPGLVEFRQVGFPEMPEFQGNVGGDNNVNVYYFIANPQEVADRANAEAEKYFAQLLVLSGWVQLTQLSALVKHLTTSPAESETISAKIPLASKVLEEASEPVKVTAEAIPFQDQPITAQAQLAKRRLKHRRYMNTQPRTRRKILLPYQIYLCTTASEEYHPESWYTDDGNGNKILDTASPAVLGQVKLFPRPLRNDEPYTPREHISLNGTVELNALTYDLLVPVPTWEFDAIEFSPVNLERSAMRPDMIPNGNFAAVFGEKKDHFPSAQDNWQRRNVREATVSVKYQMEWNGPESNLHITLENNPEDRNYSVFLVIEETLQTSVDSQWFNGATMRTPFLFPVYGQLTHVPQTFFDAIENAKAHAQKILHDFSRDHTHFHDIPPWSPEPLFHEWHRIKTLPEIRMPLATLRVLATDALRRYPEDVHAAVERINHKMRS
ncbi:MAG: hypothetical protein SF123_26695 [Chloroflexota bacterium]|nr:hypothetical protein [Chloroflexota bacterium]